MMLRPRQKLFVERSLRALDEHGNTLGVAPTGCHAAGTPILMFDGTIQPVEEICVGDRLMGPDSTPRTVLELHTGEDEMVEVRPIKGTPFVVNAGHILTLVKVSEGTCGSHATAVPGGTILDFSVEEYRQRSAYFRHLHKLFRVGADFPAREQPTLDPYFLGLLLGDGSLKHGQLAITTPDVEIVETCFAMADHLGLKVRTDYLGNNEANSYHFSGPPGGTNTLRKMLRDLGVLVVGSSEKFVPDAYRLGSRTVRQSILAGLLDTDGHLTHRCFEIVSASRRMADDIAFVARNLGLRALIAQRHVNGTAYWRLCISGDCTCLPLRVVRKMPQPRRQKKDVLRTGFTLHDVGEGTYYGFTVDGDHRYVLGDFTVTHNSGKTIMLSAAVGEHIGGGSGKAAVLAHRDELTAQNLAKFRRVNPGVSTSVVDAGQKSWGGQVTFAMVPTLIRAANLEAMPALDLLVIDEAHHAVADSYRRIIDRARDRNPDCRIYGVTATPNRGDKIGLRQVFSNVADQIRLGELIVSGHLVPPRTFIIDVGVQDELRAVRRSGDDFDMGEVARVMDTVPVTDAVVQHWQEKAGGRQTVVFCSTVAHAEHVAAAFNAAGVPTVVVIGDMPEAERRSVLAAYASGGARIVVNVAVLTEGWDHPPTSCVILLRPSSFKCTMIQMVGRGLRTVDPAEHPGIIKRDCIVLDFGTSSQIHGCLEQDVELDSQPGEGEPPTKTCPSCDAEVPIAMMECPICGHAFEPRGRETAPLAELIMTEIDLLRRSAFQWCDLFGDDAALLANGFNGWAGIFFLNGAWHAVGGAKEERPRLLSIGERLVALAAADDWLNSYETDESAHKSKRWLREPPTERQLIHLPLEARADLGMTRYQASALLTFKFNKQVIRSLVRNAQPATLGQAA